MLLLISFATVLSSFRPGRICDNVSTTELAEHMLRGKHLRLGEVSWPPYGILNSSAPQGYSGFDIDLINAVADELGFTYEVVNFIRRTNESWFDVMVRATAQTDMMLSWWTDTPERRSSLNLLLGHVDNSQVLVVQTRMASTFWEHLWHDGARFLQPFSYGLWTALVFLLFLSGVVDYLFERHKSDAKFSESIHEAFAGALYGGFHMPQSKVSAIYQIFLAFIMLIAVSAYTANMAAALTVRHTDLATVESVADLVDRKLPVCVYASWQQSTFERLFPNLLRFKTAGGSTSQQLIHSLRNRHCSAISTAHTAFDTFSMDPANCDLAMRQTLVVSTAGWVTNRQSFCVQLAVEWTLSQLIRSGFVQELTLHYLPRASCEGPDTATSNDGDRQLTVIDFSGLFALWLVITLFLIVASIVGKRLHLEQKATAMVISFNDSSQKLLASLPSSPRRAQLAPVISTEPSNASLVGVGAQLSDTVLNSS